MDQSPHSPRQRTEVEIGVARDKWDPGIWDVPLTDQPRDF